MDTTKIKKASQHNRPLKLLGIISSCGGGDWPPLLALAAGMSKRGHEVTLVCDSGTESAVRAAGISAICLPQHLNLTDFFNPVLRNILSRGEDITSQIENPLHNWTKKSLPFILNSLGKWRPTMILGSLLCLEFSERLAQILNVPWCFVNPAFYFGDGNNYPVKADFSRPGAQMYEHWLLPSAKKATMVLHATDPVFDPLQTPLPENHYYTGPLFWEKSTSPPQYLNRSGQPWVLISLSTMPQPGDMEIVQAALAALEDQPVRVLVTLAPQHDKTLLGKIPGNVIIAGYIPHSMILPMCRLAISPAGHGMVLKAIYYGAPMILVPWGRDQPGVAVRAKNLGVAAVVNRNDCGASTLAEEIKSSLMDSEVHICCQEQSTRLQKLDSLSCACECLESNFC